MGWRQLLKWHLNLNIGPILFLCPKPKQASKVQKIVWNSLTNKVKNRNTKPPDKEKRKEKARHNITRGNKTEVIRSTPSIKEVSIIIISSSHQSPSQPFSVFALTLCPHTHTHTLSLLPGDEDNLVVIIGVVVAPTLKHFCSVLLSITSWEFSKFCKLLSYWWNHNIYVLQKKNHNIYEIFLALVIIPKPQFSTATVIL